ncbi:periodic tryptophan protein 2 [Arabidopsis thaliana]|uniref:Isoform 2 of Periodic tryptophan protein 2 n=1 Tax=Arabidopsis thaliana TaxID=3702 RepID=Q8VYZ5-2|nr:periodic tryptophan protein 2 [Arabidopsis thaliana]AEE29325.1 periodic tryptophan protein 2 [Arabidopsis thaliana]|eukprot:NP_973836.1 periodic tryptophan protein 2 [Arabidopsis thaliana]
MEFRFENLLGAPYRGGNAVITKNTQLISPVGNRVSVTDLSKNHSVTLPLETSTNICRLASSPDGTFLLAVDEQNRCLFINLPRRVVLHRITFKDKVGALKFSPNGKFIAVGIGKLVEIWRSPGFRRAVLPFERVRTFANSDDKVVSLEWSLDSDYLLVGSRDLAARAFTIARDGYIFSWGYTEKDVKMDESEDGHSEPPSPVTPDRADEVMVENGGGVGTELKKRKEYDGKGLESDEEGDDDDEEYMHRGKWVLLRKDGCNQASAKVTACDYHQGLDMVVVGFSNGVFGLYQMPDFICIHLLSISRQKLTTAVFNERGNWLTFGCAKLGQLLVWDWRTETYILKQQGHYFDVNCVTYSPDSQLLATGADDNKVKVWNVMSGTCFITFTEHTNAVTALHFMADNHSLLSASLDGTVRAWDFKRYKNYKTYTTPTPRQFVSLTADPSGDVVCAGTLDSFEIFVWSKKTGQIKDILSGHEAPVHGLMFSPLTQLLASSSWDYTVRLWDVFASKGTVETFRHNHDVLTVAFRPDGKQLASSTLDGQINFWDTIEGVLMYTIEGRRDIAGGRVMTDRRSAANSSSGKCFTTLCYSADGGYILAAGTSRYICMYDIADQVLLRRFQISHNLSLDGVLDFLHSKKMTEAGPIDLIDDDNSDEEGGIDKQSRGNLGYDLPGSRPNRGRPIIRTKSLSIAPTGRSFAAATTEGVLIFSIDDTFIFDPTDLDIDVTPEAVEAAIEEDEVSRALALSMRLNEDSLIKKCIFAVAPADIKAVAISVRQKYLERLMEALVDLLENCPHLEFILHWCQEICKAHGSSIQRNYRTLLPALRSLQKAITRAHQDLADMCSSNEYTLRYLCSVPNNH